MQLSHARADGGARFFYPHDGARSVQVTGSFCDWRTPGRTLDRGEHGFLGDVEALPAGDVEYKLVVDGRWLPDPQNLSRRPDGRGGENSVLHRGGRGAIHHRAFHAPSLGASRGYVVYLPPGHATSRRRFPTLYLLHGALDGEKTWLDKGNLAGAMDRLHAEGAVGDMIVIMPRDNGELCRGDGRFADYLARDLVGHVDHDYPTLAAPGHRALDGLSTGGFTSVVLGASRSHVWGSIGSMSGCHDERTFATLHGHAAALRASGQRYRISCGLGEPHIETCRAVTRELRQREIAAEHAEAPGIHDWPLWREGLAGHLRFHWDNLRPRG